ncbi:MAG: cytochrome c oxidase subunit 3 [Pseudoxanthomonas sp.]
MSDTVIQDQHAGSSYVPGEPGLWWVVFWELTVYSLLIFGVAHYKSVSPEMVGASQSLLDQNLGLINTILLLTGSLFVALGVSDCRAGKWQAAKRWFRLAFVSGVVFGIDKYIEYSSKFAHDITPLTNEFFASYFILTAFHMLHVVVASILLLFMARYSTPQAGPAKFKFIEGSACFWHMVDVIWVILYFVLYLL